MNFFKRAWLFIFGLAGLFCLFALALPWFGPWVEITRSMLEASWYRGVVLAALAVTAIGLLVSFCRALFTPRRRTTVMVSKQGGDEVTVTTAAIASQAAHIVEEGDLFFADKVTVKVGRRGRARVAIKVHPAYAVDITQEGQRLREELAEGLSKLCGNAVRSISLEFVQSDSQEQAPVSEVDYEELAAAADAAYELAEASSYEPAEAPSYEIADAPGMTLPMSRPQAASPARTGEEG